MIIYIYIYIGSSHHLIIHHPSTIPSTLITITIRHPFNLLFASSSESVSFRFMPASISIIHCTVLHSEYRTVVMQSVHRLAFEYCSLLHCAVLLLNCTALLYGATRKMVGAVPTAVRLDPIHIFDIHNMGANPLYMVMDMVMVMMVDDGMHVPPIVR